MKRLITLALISMLLAPLMASAHTIAVGTTNSGVAGSVTIWMGSYHTGTFTQGAITIGTQTVNFSSAGLGSALPDSNLVWGSNIFYADNGAQGSYTSATNVTCCTLQSWQKATLTGLSAGPNTYSITGMSSAHWADWNSSQNNWTGSLFIPTSSISTPEPGALVLLSLGLAGLGFGRKKRS